MLCFGRFRWRSQTPFEVLSILKNGDAGGTRKENEKTKLLKFNNLA